MDDQPTCGKGLAEHSALPATLGALTDAVADNLELHMNALDRGDEKSRIEYDAYAQLAKEHRSTAAQLHATAERMAAYRDLPMGRHDEGAMAAGPVLEAFDRFLRLERELLALLQHRVERDAEMLTGMREMRRARDAGPAHQ